MGIQDSFINRINFTETYFLSCLIFNFIATLFLVIVPHLELKWNLLTKLFSKKWRAADGYAYFLIHLATLRFYNFFECVITQEKIILPTYYLFILACIGSLLIVFGSYLLVSGFRLLGLRGMYFGDHFGYVFPEKIHEFPYNKFSDPQYFGINLIYFGISIAYASPSGIILSLILYLCNQITFQVEKRKLNLFYPEHNE